MTGTLDLDHLRQWIGRTEEVTDVVTAHLVRGLRATLFMEIGAPKPGDAASLLEEAAHLPPVANLAAFNKERARAAGARIRELRKGVTLGGLTVRELIDEGRP